VATTDGQTMLVWEVRPPDFDPARTYPAVLYMQGGPQSALSQFFSYRWNFHALAAQGYVVVAPNRRGMPGHGTAWNEQISGDWGGQAMDDLLSAIDAVAAEPYVDAERLAAIGASFGGYSAFWLAGTHEGRFKTFVAHAGIFHLESMVGATEELFFVEHDLGGLYWDSPRPPSYDRFSPHQHAHRWDTPMLITHGELDYRVPLEQGLQAYTALRRQGVEGRLVTFPGEGHWINRPQNSLAWHREVYGWLARFLAP
jgi:dipeptidyl aminopeptidase/acylaminoacyl peptidase